MVLVSHSKQFIFLKTHKTGSTSFEMMLQPFCTPPGLPVSEKVDEMVTEYGLVGARMNRSHRVPTWRNHVSAQHVFDFVGPDRWQSYLKLTSVRNPYARAISQFYFQFTWKKLPLPQGIDAQRSAFRLYALSPDFIGDAYVTHINGRYAMDDGFRLEHIDEDLARIGSRLGLSLTRADLPRTKDNAGGKPDLDFYAFFTPEIVEAIKRKQGWVFENFGYSLQVADCRL